MLAAWDYVRTSARCQSGHRLRSPSHSQRPFLLSGQVRPVFNGRILGGNVLQPVNVFPMDRPFSVALSAPLRGCPRCAFRDTHPSIRIPKVWRGFQRLKCHKMSQDSGEFKWTRGAEKVAWEVARDAYTDEKIGELVGISRRTLGRWKEQPEFAARVEEHVDCGRSCRGLAGLRGVPGSWRVSCRRPARRCVSRYGRP